MNVMSELCPSFGLLQESVGVACFKPWQKWKASHTNTVWKFQEKPGAWTRRCSRGNRTLLWRTALAPLQGCTHRAHLKTNMAPLKQQHQDFYISHKRRLHQQRYSENKCAVCMETLTWIFLFIIINTTHVWQILKTFVIVRVAACWKITSLKIEAKV